MPDAIVELPLFPLNAVLFPASRLPLTVFEARYREMLSQCFHEGSRFGVCLVGAELDDSGVGCCASVDEWDDREPGLLKLAAVGEQRFRIRHRQSGAKGLILAVVEWLPEPEKQTVPESLADLLPLLQIVVADAGEQTIPVPHRFDDASWVGNRYAEILPIPLKAKQKLLELDDPLLRLSIIHEFLVQRNFLKKAG